MKNTIWKKKNDIQLLYYLKGLSLRAATGVFCVLVKALNNDLGKRIDPKTDKILMT